MQIKKFYLFQIILSVLIAACKNSILSKIKAKHDHCMDYIDNFQNLECIGLMPQRKVKVDWDKMNGDWFEVFRIHKEDYHSPDYLNSIYNMHNFAKNDNSTINQSFAFYDTELEDYKFFKGHTLHKTNDKANSRYKIYNNWVDNPSMPMWKRIIWAPIAKKFYINYSILNIDSDYNWCLFGEPQHNNAYLILKNGAPALDQSVIDENLKILKINGYKITGDILRYLPYPNKSKYWSDK